jgi:4-hydroxybenzoate polyprenyltransferase
MGIAQKIARIPELVKLENSIFVLPFTYIGMFFAGTFTIVQFLFITLALIAARGAAFAANRYLGLKYDRKNPKKTGWSSVSLYSKQDIAVIFVAFAILFMASALALNLLAFLLSPIILAIVAFEPFLKKRTAHRHMIMGFVIGLGIIGGYIGIAGSFPTSPELYILLLGYMCFSASNDIVYSMSHVAFDRSHGLKTYPTVYGINKAKRISLYLHLWSSALFIEFGSLTGSTIVVLFAALTIPVFIIEDKSLSNASDKSIGSVFFKYNAVVSLMMLVSVAFLVLLHL